MRDKNGRYIKKQQNIIIDMPSISSLIKYSIIIFIFAPWIYILVYKFDLFSIIEEVLSYLFGPKIIGSPGSNSKETPY
ncbi:MAG: hypothetical protein AUK63_2646 [bacterium P3]|nr:MAG: hypothetical protein AUK63_2646 [bacterium P3]